MEVFLSKRDNDMGIYEQKNFKQRIKTDEDTNILVEKTICVLQ